MARRLMKLLDRITARRQLRHALREDFSWKRRD
jgi:hypothetical protein